MSQYDWATILQFGPVTNFLLAQNFFFGPAKGCPHFRHWFKAVYVGLHFFHTCETWPITGGLKYQMESVITIHG
jgi:hypothetical protein